MRIFGRLVRKDRTHWFVCYTCMTQTGHDTLNSVFYSKEPPLWILGRPWQQCPRCRATNTRSFQDLKNEGSENALFGLERIVSKYPRGQFEVGPVRS
jgi:hypothetical protein